MAVRLNQILPEYQARMWLRLRPFPLEVVDGEAAPRDILAQEWWLAALQWMHGGLCHWPTVYARGHAGAQVPHSGSRMLRYRSHDTASSRSRRPASTGARQ